MLTLNQVAANPHLLAWRIALPTGRKYGLRPITAADETGLREFVTQLSDRTRRFYSIVRSPAATAAEWCGGIARYDKLRLLITDGRLVVGVVEFSLDLPSGDVERFRSYGCALQARSDCRFGLCIVDSLQDQGLGTALLPPAREIARRFGRKRIILWGGVMVENTRAVAYYRKVGFRVVGEFVNSDGTAAVDMVLEI